MLLIHLCTIALAVFVLDENSYILAQSLNIADPYPYPETTADPYPYPEGGEPKPVEPIKLSIDTAGKTLIHFFF